MTRYAVTLFSGLGSSSKALRDLGYEVLAHDFMPEAVATLRANGFNACEVDVRAIDYSAARYSGDIEIVAGGPPCQPFSQSHDGEGRYDERDMIPEFLRAVAELMPRLFVMEEVQTLTWKRHADYLEMVEDHMRALGYRVEHQVLDASKFGLGQARKRLFVVGVREDVAQEREHFVAPCEVIEWPAQDREPQTMADLLGWDMRDCWDRNQQVPDPRARVALPGSVAYLWPLERPSTTVVGSFRPEVQAAPGYRKAGDGPRQATPGSVVTTHEERLKLQDMPTDWVVCGSTAKRDLQVGNSVPCGLIRDIFRRNA
jgi:DNA (cytosine-5)-methyltransferase 1